MAINHYGHQLREVTAGFTTFAAMSYIMFTNPAILSGMTPAMPAAPVFLWTCFVGAAASLASAFILKKVPSALACGMGLNLFVVTYSGYNNVPWPYLIIICFIVSVVVFATSISSFRHNLLQAVPDQIISAIKAGIGVILATVPIHAIARFANEKDANGVAGGQWQAFLLFAVGLIIILSVKMLCAYKLTKPGLQTESGDDPDRMSPGWQWGLLESGAFFLSIVSLMILIWLVHPPANFEVEQWQYFTWSAAMPLLAPFHGEHLINSVAFALAVFVMMTIDIAGSPIDYLKQGFVARSEPEAQLLVQQHATPRDDIVVIPPNEQEDLIRAGLKLDSGFNIIAAAVGITPIVFYAENHAGWQAKGRTGLSTAVVAMCFLLFAIIGLVCIWFRLPIIRVIPELATMPTLFFVGTMVVADSFVVPTRVGDRFAMLADDPAEPQTKAPVAGHAERTPAGRTLYFVPAAITAILVPVTESLDVSIAAGILAHLVISYFPNEYLGARDEKSFGLGLVYVGAALILIVNLATRHWSPS